MDSPVIEVISVVIIVKIITAAGIKHKKDIILNIGDSRDFQKWQKRVNFHLDTVKIFLDKKQLNLHITEKREAKNTTHYMSHYSGQVEQDNIILLFEMQN